MQRAFFVTLALALVACEKPQKNGTEGASQSSSGRIVIQNKGSDTLVNVAQAWAETYKGVDANVAIAVTGGGSGTGISAMINGTVDIANSSRKMRDSEIEAARERGQDPIDTAVDLIRGGSVSIVSFNMSDEDVEVLMAQPWTITASDGSLVPWNEGVPHPRSYGTFPRKIRLYVGEKGTVTLEHAIRSMTSLPAAVYGLKDRGLLREGAAADVVVFDLARVRDLAEYTAPHQLAEGMGWVFVNGQAAVRGGEVTEAMAGRVLQKGR